jgi:mono/diheme cytochrome c family protein
MICNMEFAPPTVGTPAHEEVQLTKAVPCGWMRSMTIRAVAAVAVAIGAICSVSASNAADAARIYSNRCAFCHGNSGKGDGPAGIALKPPPRNLADGEYWKRANTAEIKKLIADGKPGTAMTPFKDILSDDDIAAVVEYLKTFAPPQ